jgi:hypothetical protein
MESGIERALLDFERIFRRVLDDLCDGVTVRAAHEQRAQDEHVERALKNLTRYSGLLKWHGARFTRMSRGTTIFHSKVMGKCFWELIPGSLAARNHVPGWGDYVGTGALGGFRKVASNIIPIASNWATKQISSGATWNRCSSSLKPSRRSISSKSLRCH